MKPSFIIELYRKYIAGTASKDEAELLERHYELFDDRPDGLRDLRPEEIDSLASEIEQRIEEQIGDNERPKSRRTLLFSAISLAACLLIAIPFFLKDNKSTESRELKASTNRFVLLPDSSLVVLSAGSTLTFPASFNGSTREVKLEGEAYFDVKKAAGKPFIIISGNLRTTVLGTAFTVSAWPDKNPVVTVERGKVQVDDINHRRLGVLSPNHQIIYKSDREAETRAVTSLDYIKWREEDLLLSDVSFDEARLLLEDRYNAKVEISGQALRQLRFTTRVKKGEPIQSVLNGLAEFNGAELKFDSTRNVYSLSPAGQLQQKTK